MNDQTAKLIDELRRTSARTPDQKAEETETRMRIDVLISSGEISADELSHGVLRAVLKVYGRNAEVSRARSTGPVTDLDKRPLHGSAGVELVLFERDRGPSVLRPAC